MDTLNIWLSVAIFLGVYILLATEVIEKSVAAILGACLTVFFGLISWEGVVAAIELDVIFLLIGMMTCVAILAETGFFECVAIWVAKTMKGRPIPILVMLMIVTMVFSAFLDNVTTIILLVPVTILITQLLELPTVPFLIFEALASNIGGTATMIGDPPNIIIGSKAHLAFMDFMINLTPGVLIIGTVFILYAVVLFSGSMKVSEQTKLRVINSYPELAIIDKKRMYKALGVFGLIFLGFFLHHTLDVKPGIVALAGMCIMLIVCKSDSEHMLKSVEWDAILFFIGLFIIIGALEHNGVIDKLAEVLIGFCEGSLLKAGLVILVGSAIFSAILDNIPFVIAMTPMVKKLIVEMDPSFDGISRSLVDGAEVISVVGSHPLFWALALGACLGGNGTIIGASANVVAAKIGERNGCRITFLGFMKHGVPVTAFTVLLAMVYFWLVIC